ncbi:MAG TPA: prolyl oligopeptidase family serine peptidase [Tepidisphaeraceae bacterium]
MILIVLCATCLAAGREDAVIPGDNLVLDGIPPIPARLADDVRPYTNFRGAGIASWHPVRREMLIYTQFGEAPQIHVVKCPGGARTQLTFFRDPVSDATFQPTRGDSFVLSKDSGGDENFQKYRYDLFSGAITLLTDGTSRNTGGVWSHAGERFVYGSTRRNGRDVDLWLIDPANRTTDRMLARLDGGGWTPLDFSPDDRQLLVREGRSEVDSSLWTFDVATGRGTRLTPVGNANPVCYADAQFARDGTGIYVISDRDCEFKRFAFIDLATGQPTYFTASIPWDISEFSLSFDGKTLACVSNEEGRSVLRLLDAASGRELLKPDLPAGVIHGLRWHRNNRDLGFSFIDARRGSDVYSIDVVTRKVVRWTLSESGGINTSRFAEPRLFHWKTFDDRTLSGWIYPPPADRFKGRRPVIVEIHGGPESQARPWLSSGNSYLVNEMGIVLIQPNVRGSSGYGKSFLKLDDGYRREDAYKDIGTLLDWIRIQPDLDPARVMVTGGSYGGHMTLAVATRYPERIRCALDIVGQSNLVTFLEHTSPYRQDLRRVEYGDERDPQMRLFLNSIAPLNHAGNITKPLFVVQGTNDPRVPQSESEQMVRTVRGSGTPVWYLLAKDEGHGFVKKKNEESLLLATVMFVQEYLLN